MLLLAIVVGALTTRGFGQTAAIFPKGEISTTDNHIHPAGQVLVITEGTGYYQEKGKPKQIVHKGDVK
jgi:quercetin dioxygenase-like cupin family protein